VWSGVSFRDIHLLIYFQVYDPTGFFLVGIFIIVALFSLVGRGGFRLFPLDPQV
jgi:hypothetical protein